MEIQAGNKGLDGDKKVPEVRGTSDQEGPFCLVNKLMYKYFLNNFLRIITIFFYLNIARFCTSFFIFKPPVYKILYTTD